MPKRTFQPNRRHRSKTHGFLTRMKTKAGRAVISRRRAKGRKRVSVKPGFRGTVFLPFRNSRKIRNLGFTNLGFANLV